MKVQNRYLHWFLAVLGLSTVVLLCIALKQMQHVEQAQDLAQTLQRTAVSEANMRATAQAEAEARQTEVKEADATAEALRIAVENAQATAEAEHASSEQQAQIALARHLTLQARYVLDTFPEQLPRALLLAVESLHRYPECAADQVLAEGLALFPPEVKRLTYETPVQALAFSPDGRWAASGSNNGAVQVWEVETGRAIAQKRHQGRVLAVAFSPDGQRLICAIDNTALVLEATSGREVARMTHAGTVNAVAFHPDGRLAISGSGDGTAIVWEATTGREVGRTVYADMVTAVTFSDDKPWVATTSYNDTTAYIWEAANKRELLRIKHANRIVAVAFSPDRRLAASGSTDGTIRVWEIATGREVTQVRHKFWAVALAFSPDGQWLISGSWDGVARVWETATGREVARMPHADAVNAVTFSPDRRWALSGGNDKTARLWDISPLSTTGALPGREVVRLSSVASAPVVAFSPDGRWLVSGKCEQLENALCANGAVRVWDLAALTTGTTEREAIRITYDDAPGWVSTVVFSADGRWFVAGNTTLHVYDWPASVAALAGREVAQITRQGLAPVMISPDGQWIASTIAGDLEVWETGTGRALVETPEDILRVDGWTITAVAFSPDGKRVAAGSGTGAVRVWELASLDEVALIKDQLGGTSLAFSPDGQKIVIGGCAARASYGCSSGSAVVWDLNTTPAREVARMEHRTDVRFVAFSPNGQWVISTSDDDTIRVWEVETEREIARMTHEGVVNTVAFSPDGRWLLSGSEDKTARVWETATGREIARMMHTDDVRTVAFSPNGQWVVSTAWDEDEDKCFARLWWWQPEDMIALTCSRLTRNLTREEWQHDLGDEPYHATCPNLPVDANHE